MVTGVEAGKDYILYDTTTAEVYSKGSAGSGGFTNLLSDMTATGRTVTVWTPAPYADTKSTFAVLLVEANASGNMTFNIPSNWYATVSCDVIVIPDANGTAEDIDFTTEYGLLTELYNNHTETDTTRTYTYTANTLTNISITNILTGIQSGDYVGLELDHNAATKMNYLGIVFRYINKTDQ